MAVRTNDFGREFADVFGLAPVRLGEHDWLDGREQPFHQRNE